MIDAYQGGARHRDGQPHEHHLAGLLLCHLRVLPGEHAIEAIRESIRDTYGRKGEEIVQKNMKAVDETLAHLFEVNVPAELTSTIEMPPPFSPAAPEFERNVLGTIYRRPRRRTAGQRVSGRRHLPHRHSASGRSAISRLRFRSGTARSASSAASAPWFARTR